MNVSLKSLAYMDDFTLLKIILSSADKFPGLYRFASSWGQGLQEVGFLRLLPYLEICHLTSKGETWSKDDWFSTHSKIFSMWFGPNGRNVTRADQDVGSFLKERAIDWISAPNSFSLAVIDIDNPVTKIEVHKSYYMMGSIIKFENDAVHISHDCLQKKSYLELRVPFDEVSNYINQIFGQRSLSELFYHSEIVGQLDFDESGEGRHIYSEEQLYLLLASYSPSSMIFATVNYAQNLPIKLAKLIGVSDVR